jgi:HTH-type transcriptional regulator/antitoxin HigA
MLKRRNMNIHPIRIEADYDAALGEVEDLWGAKARTPEGDRLDVLLVLVHDYESKHHPVDPPDPVDAIRFRVEQMNLTRKDLEPLLGPRGRVAEVLNRRRPLSLAMIRNLHQKLRIPLESLIADGALAANKRKQRTRQSVTRLAKRQMRATSPRR